MTQTVAAPAQAPDLTQIRTVKTNETTRVFVGGDLLGRVDHVRMPTGRGRQRCWRWIAKPAGYAWTQGRTFDGGAPPVRTEWLAELEPAITKHAAIDALVRHLHQHGAVSVAPLYGGARV